MTANKRNMSSAEMKDQVLEKIAQLSEPNRPLAEKVHSLIMEALPELHPRLWYDMPGYTKTKDSAVLCFFREDEKYMTFGFTEAVDVSPGGDSGSRLMPCAWFFTEMNEATEEDIKSIVSKI